MLSQATLKDEDILTWVRIAGVTHMSLTEFQGLTDLQKNAVVIAVEQVTKEAREDEDKRTQAITTKIENAQQSQPQPLAKPSFIQY